MTCKECKWWEDSAVVNGTSVIAVKTWDGGKDQRIGSCHRHSPITHFPITVEDSWCGDFEPLTVEPQKPTTDHAK